MPEKSFSRSDSFFFEGYHPRSYSNSPVLRQNNSSSPTNSGFNSSNDNNSIDNNDQNVSYSIILDDSRLHDNSSNNPLNTINDNNSSQFSINSISESRLYKFFVDDNNISSFNESNYNLLSSASSSLIKNDSNRIHEYSSSHPNVNDNITDNNTKNNEINTNANNSTKNNTTGNNKMNNFILLKNHSSSNTISTSMLLSNHGSQKADSNSDNSKQRNSSGNSNDSKQRNSSGNSNTSKNSKNNRFIANKGFKNNILLQKNNNSNNNSYELPPTIPLMSSTSSSDEFFTASSNSNKSYPTLSQQHKNKPRSPSLIGNLIVSPTLPTAAQHTQSYRLTSIHESIFKTVDSPNRHGQEDGLPSPRLTGLSIDVNNNTDLNNNQYRTVTDPNLTQTLRSPIEFSPSSEYLYSESPVTSFQENDLLFNDYPMQHIETSSLQSYDSYDYSFTDVFSPVRIMTLLVISMLVPPLFFIIAAGKRTGTLPDCLLMRMIMNSHHRAGLLKGFIWHVDLSWFRRLCLWLGFIELFCIFACVAIGFSVGLTR